MMEGILGSRHSLGQQIGKACLLTLTNRESRHLLYKKVVKKNFKEIAEAMIELFEI